ncbi:recombinase family protein [Oribacterium sp. NK2B42]|uniref:recombinase family protein n=1 Tax=Oribacterium sp. NK2B42 TaxID=689781 RepID=UPI00040BA038|nr:recombinase family protein [Oribacterium sp. NK2B42]
MAPEHVHVLSPRQSAHTIVDGLSKEDEDSREGESQSISHQREIIEGFCKKKGWRVEDVYVDEGYSGSTSNRPSLQRLLSDMAAANSVAKAM